MKILVTGGAGYIGSVVAAHLIKSGHEVVAYDNLSHGHREAIPAEAIFVEGDVGDEDALQIALGQGCEALVHFAALIEAGESMLWPDKYFDNNVAKSHVLISKAVKAGINKIVFSSTAAVYATSNNPLLETDTIAPTNVYGQTKRMTEEMLEWYAKTWGVKVACLRYFNAAGATLIDSPPNRGEAHSPESHLIPNIMAVALGQKETIMLNGEDYETIDGTCVRDYIHVDDLAEAHILALNLLAQEKTLFDVFNLGNGQGFSVKQVIATTRKITGHPIPVEIGSRRPGDAPKLVANCEKAKQILGWQPQHTDLETIISSAWAWHKNHPKGFES